MSDRIRCDYNTDKYFIVGDTHQERLFDSIHDAKVALREMDISIAVAAATRLLKAENERLRYHLEGTLETLLDAEVCPTDCVPCNEARTALGEKQ